VLDHNWSQIHSSGLYPTTGTDPANLSFRSDWECSGIVRTDSLDSLTYVSEWGAEVILRYDRCVKWFKNPTHVAMASRQ